MSLQARMPDGRLISGAAAQQHIIKEDGGWDEHHRKFAQRVVDNVMREYNRELTHNAFQVIDGNKKTG